MSRTHDEARAALAAGDVARAEDAMRAVLRARPGDAEAHDIYGLAALVRGDAAEAVKRLERAARLAPKQPFAHLHLAEARYRTRDLAGAERAARRARDLAPQMPEPWNLIGLAELDRCEYANAITSFREAMTRRPEFTEAVTNLAVACNRTGEHALAVQLCEHALRTRPNDTNALIDLGMAYKGLRELPQAKAAFAAAGAHPKARFNLGHVLLLEGDLAQGLPLYEERLRVLPPDPALGAMWDGSSAPHATLLVECEQGLGDTLLMSRFFPALCERFAKVVVHAPEPLQRLLLALDPRLDVVTSRTGRTWDLWCPSMSLPLRLGVRSLDDVPTVPWLHVAGAPRNGNLLRVGINWAGNPKYAYDYVRSTSLEAFAPLLAIEGVEWVSLHRGAREHEAESFGLPQPLRSAHDFYDTAQVLAGLDLVISTETAVPNLSAAMGVPTCVLTVRDVDWRWSDWYAGVTVCAQRESGDWSGPIADAAAVIEALRPVRAAA